MAASSPPAPRRRHGAPSVVAGGPIDAVNEARPARRRGRGVLGWWSAMVFNAALLGLPVALTGLVASMEGVQLARYEATAPALAAAKSAIEGRLKDLAPREVPREQALSFLVGREATEGDAESARGVLMAAGSILPGPQATRLYQGIKAASTDEDIASAAARFLEPTVADAYARIQSGRAASGGAFFLVGDGRELAQAARRWLETADSDSIGLILTGLTVVDFGVSADEAASIRVGASVLKSARAAGRLSPELSTSVSGLAEQAFPVDALRAELTRALSSPAALSDEGAAASQAFQSVRYEPAFRAMIPVLAAVRRVAAETSPSGALRLIAHARDPKDFERLSLLAQAGRERAVALAKRTAIDANLVSLAPVTWRVPASVLYFGGALALCVLILLIATVCVLRQALERAAQTSAPIGSALEPHRIGRAKALPNPHRTDAAAVL